jgi:tight adherence protein B
MLYVLFFLAAFLAVEGIYFLLQGRREEGHSRARQRLRRLAAGLQAPGAQVEESVLRRARAGDSFTDRVFRLVPRGETLELHLYRAGLTIPPQRFVVLSIALAVGGWIVGSILFADPGRALIFILLGGLPWLQMNRLERKRMKEFEKQFPDALDLLIRALRAGHSLTFAFQMVGEELPDPIGTEFAQVAEEIKFGLNVRDALANLEHRIDVADLPFFITAIGIQRETGGNLAEVLEKLGHLIRERFKLYGKVRALTAIGRASANLLALWPFVMVFALWMVAPDYVSPLWKSRAGHLLAFVGGVLIVVGYFLARRMAIIRV